MIVRSFKILLLPFSWTEHCFKNATENPAIFLQMPKICRKWKNPLQELKTLLRVQQISAWNGRTHNNPLQKRKNPPWIGRTQPDYRRSHHGMEEPTPTMELKNPTQSTQDPTMEHKNPSGLRKDLIGLHPEA
jgi:hypothetical protein